MRGGDAVPYFPFRPQLDQDASDFINPINASVHPFSDGTKDILSLCDGYRTREEIVLEMMRRLRTGRASVETRMAPVLNRFTAAGVLWWREHRAGPEEIPPPQFVQWDLTTRCNLACRHCVVAAGAPQPGELSFEDCRRLIDDLTETGVLEAVFSGGEPMIRSDFFDIAEYAVARKMSLVVATNATLITKDKAERLASLGLGAHVSLDGATPLIHDEFRGVEGAWRRTIRGLRNLRSAGVSFVVASAVNRLNIGQIPQLYALAKELGAHTFRILPFVPYGRGAMFRDLEVTPAQMRDLTRFLWDRRKNGDLPVAAMEFECVFEPPSSGAADPFMRIGCDGAVSYCTITATGDVLPCDFFAGAEAENVLRHPFSWIWKNSRFLKYFRSLTVSDLRGPCGACGWLSACRGSCLASNFTQGDIFQSNCHCWLAHPEDAGRPSL